MRKAISGILAIGCLGIATNVFAVDVESLYGQKCALCHGSRGEGTATGPAHKGDEFIMTARPSMLKRVIMEGRSGFAKEYRDIPVDMPKGLVSEAEADALVTFLQGDLQH